MRPDVPEVREPQPRAVVRPGRHPDRHRLGTRLQADAAARPARLHPLHARALAPRARAREDHVSPRRAQLAGAVALRARRARPSQRPGTGARLAARLPRDREPSLGAAQRLVELQHQRRVQVGAAGVPRRVRARA